MVVPAWGDAEIECEAKAHAPGPFRAPMHLNFYDGDYYRSTMYVSGTAVARRADDEPKRP